MLTFSFPPLASHHQALSKPRATVPHGEASLFTRASTGMMDAFPSSSPQSGLQGAEDLANGSRTKSKCGRRGQFALVTHLTSNSRQLQRKRGRATVPHSTDHTHLLMP